MHAADGVEGKGECMVVIEHRVEIPAAASEVFRFLSDPSNVPLFAPGIEEAILSGGASGHEGARLDLTTRSGRHVSAQITRFWPGEGWRVMDERGTLNEWNLEEAAPGRTVATNTLRGEWPARTAAAIDTEAEEKVASLARAFEAASVPRA